MINVRMAQPEDVDSLMRLYHVLSQNYQDDRAAVLAALRHPATKVLVADEDGRVLGTATVSYRAVPSKGLAAYVDDVVADPTCRGRGLGSTLTNACVSEARAWGCCRVELTTRADRLEANRLYEKLGFRLRETNAYVLDLLP